MKPFAAVLLLLAACGAPPKPALSPEDERVLRPVPDVPDGGVQSLIDRGDAYFVKAIADPASALDNYARARASYLEAQTHFGGLVPPALLDRVKECVTRIAALQRRVHSASSN
jgi:hypothetical protein